MIFGQLSVYSSLLSISFSRVLVLRVTRCSGTFTLPCLFVSVRCKCRLNWPLPPHLLCHREGTSSSSSSRLRSAVSKETIIDYPKDNGSFSKRGATLIFDLTILQRQLSPKGFRKPLKLVSSALSLLLAAPAVYLLRLAARAIAAPLL